MSTQVESTQKIEARFRVGEWLVEPSLNRVSRDGVAVQLELKAMDVLLCLAGRLGELVDKHELVDVVWQTEFVADNTLTRRIADLRDAFGDDARNPRYIETIPKRGYRLIAEVAFFDDASAGFDSALTETRSDETSPYPGLAPFTEADTDNFFGRESEITTLWRRITNCRLLAVIGPSGAGKSSLLRAGVIARAPPGWRAVHCQPGEDPVLALARALAPDLADDAGELRQLLAFHDPDIALAVSARWRGRWDEALLVVDQFEELFTLNPEPVQERFCELLRRLVDAAGIHVVLVLRDDFLLECHRHPKLAPIFNHLTPVGPPAATELRRALTEPAARHLYGFESELLVDEMIGEVEAERGALPLLAFAVSRLWELRDPGRRLLTREAYEKIGGVGGALARHAEATLEAIGHERLPVVRELFRNLVTAQGTRATRQWDDLLSIFNGGGREGVKPSPTRTPHRTVGEGLIPSREAAEKVLNQLIDARLLTSYEVREEEEESTRRVEIVHESLLRAWPRLVRWQTRDADAAQLRDQLRQAARLWHERGRPRDLLWQGASYRELDLWLENYPGGLSATEDAFVRAARDHAERRCRRRRRVAAGVFLALTAVAASQAWLWRDSVRQTRRAEARFLQARVQANLSTNNPSALAFATASLERADDPRVRALALESLWRGPMPLSLVKDPTGKSIAADVDLSPDQRWLSLAFYDGSVRLWDSSGREVAFRKTVDSPPGEPHPTTALFLPDSTVLVTLTLPEPVMRFWSVPGLEALSVQPLERPLDIGKDLKPVTTSTWRRLFGFEKSTDPAGVEWSADEDSIKLLQKWAGTLDVAADIDHGRKWMIYGASRQLWALDLTAADETMPQVVGRTDRDLVQLVFDPKGVRFATLDSGGEVGSWALKGALRSPFDHGRRDRRGRRGTSAFLHRADFWPPLSTPDRPS